MLTLTRTSPELAAEVSNTVKSKVSVQNAYKPADETRSRSWKITVFSWKILPEKREDTCFERIFSRQHDEMRLET